MSYKIKGGPRDGEIVEEVGGGVPRRVGDHIRVRKSRTPFSELFFIIQEGIIEPAVKMIRFKAEVETS